MSFTSAIGRDLNSGPGELGRNVVPVFRGGRPGLSFKVSGSLQFPTIQCGNLSRWSHIVKWAVSASSV